MDKKRVNRRGARNRDPDAHSPLPADAESQDLGLGRPPAAYEPYERPHSEPCPQPRALIRSPVSDYGHNQDKDKSPDSENEVTVGSYASTLPFEHSSMSVVSPDKVEEAKAERPSNVEPDVSHRKRARRREKFGPSASNYLDAHIRPLRQKRSNFTLTTPREKQASLDPNGNLVKIWTPLQEPEPIIDLAPPFNPRNPETPKPIEAIPGKPKKKRLRKRAARRTLRIRPPESDSASEGEIVSVTQAEEDVEELADVAADIPVSASLSSVTLSSVHTETEPDDEIRIPRRDRKPEPFTATFPRNVFKLISRVVQITDSVRSLIRIKTRTPTDPRFAIPPLSETKRSIFRRLLALRYLKTPRPRNQDDRKVAVGLKITFKRESIGRKVQKRRKLFQSDCSETEDVIKIDDETRAHTYTNPKTRFLRATRSIKKTIDHVLDPDSSADSHRKRNKKLLLGPNPDPNQKANELSDDLDSDPSSSFYQKTNKDLLCDSDLDLDSDSNYQRKTKKKLLLGPNPVPYRKTKNKHLRDLDLDPHFNHYRKTKKKLLLGPNPEPIRKTKNKLLLGPNPEPIRKTKKKLLLGPNPDPNRKTTEELLYDPDLDPNLNFHRKTKHKLLHDPYLNPNSNILRKPKEFLRAPELYPKSKSHRKIKHKALHDPDLGPKSNFRRKAKQKVVQNPDPEIQFRPRRQPLTYPEEFEEEEEDGLWMSNERRMPADVYKIMAKSNRSPYRQGPLNDPLSPHYRPPVFVQKRDPEAERAKRAQAEAKEVLQYFPRTNFTAQFSHLLPTGRRVLLDPEFL